MNRAVLAVGLAVLIALSGCSSITGVQSDGDTGPAVGTERVAVADDASDATDVNYTLQIEADETTSGSELSAVGGTFPRDRFTVNSAKHEAVSVGVDTDGDEELDRTFDESNVSGVNNNAYTFDVTLETGYALQQGDVVVVGYPAVDNPSEPGDYDVEVRLNDRQRANGTVSIR